MSIGARRGMFATLDSDVRSYRTRVETAGGTLTNQSQLATNYLVTAMKSTSLWTKVANGGVWTLDGGHQSVHTPVFIKPGRTSSAVSIEAGDYSDSLGWIQDGTTSEYIDTGIRMGDLGLLGFQGASYHSGNVSAHRSLLGAIDGSGASQVAILLDYRRVSSDIFGGFRHPAPSILPIVVESGVTAGTANRIYVNRSSASSLRLFSRGTAVATNTTNQTGSWSSAITRTVRLGVRDDNGSTTLPATATLTHAILTDTPFSDAEVAIYDAIIAEYLNRRGRPNSS